MGDNNKYLFELVSSREIFFFSSRRRHTRSLCDWSSDVCSSDLDASLFDKGESAVLTYWPSEFGQVRGQYRRTNYAVGPIANELLFQFQFSIGAHGAHPF